MNLNEYINDLLSQDPFDINFELKRDKLINIIRLQIKHHTKNCVEYKRWYDRNSFVHPSLIKDYSQIPFLPSSVFKHINLFSINKQVKLVKSSGTTSQIKSNIIIDRKTSFNQRKSLSKILSSVLGKQRKTFFIVDVKPTSSISAENSMSARFAGMSGYLLAAKSVTYLLKQNDLGNLEVDFTALASLNEQTNKDPIIIIGYTYMLWKYLLNNSAIKFEKISLDKDSKIIHFGGWKKLRDEHVSKKQLIQIIMKKLNLEKDSIFDIYGFTEQLGTIYTSRGFNGCSVGSYSHVLVRDVNTLEIVPDGTTGFLQFISILPLSYPGFCLLNDDIGYISKRTLDKKGVETLEFKLQPRLEEAEARGCGDTLPESYYI